MDSFVNRTAPRSASWNYVDTAKHMFLSELKPMNATMVEYSDHIWRRRLRSLQSVDHLVARLFATVEGANALNQTVFV